MNKSNISPVWDLVRVWSVSWIENTHQHVKDIHVKKNCLTLLLKWPVLLNKFNFIIIIYT